MGRSEGGGEELGEQQQSTHWCVEPATSDKSQSHRVFVRRACVVYIHLVKRDNKSSRNA